MTECWCDGGKRGYSQHVQRKVKTTPCAESRQANAKYQRKYVGRQAERWVPGTDVDLTDDAL